MFSYRHAFHAGNHADVLKHFIQVQLHQYMNQKDAAYTYIDTHSGVGVYALDSAQAVKSGESEGGIARLWERDDLPPALAEYVELVRKMNPAGRLRFYPGSPYVAEQVARAQDRLRLFELHPADIRLLAENFRKLEAHKAEQGERPRGKRVIVEYADGFQSLKALLPPPSRRALVLVDPPYEVKLDYKHVRDALEDALGRFPSGMYAVWYPVLQRMESRQFPDRLKRLPAKEWLHVTLTVSTPGPDGTGMHSSGMFILNPPYTLEAALRETLPYLVKVLGTDKGATFRIETGTQVTGAMPGLAGAERSGGRQPVGNARRASPLSGKGSLRLPGQAFGDGPRGRAAEGQEGQDRKAEAPRRAGQRPAADARPGQGGTGKAGAGQGRPGQARPGQARSGEARSGQARESEGRPASAPSGARPGVRLAATGEAPRRPAKRNGPGRP